MNLPVDIQNQAKKLIIHDLPAAVGLLQTHCTDHPSMQDQLLLLQGRLSDIKSNAVKGLLTAEETETRYARVRNDLLNLLQRTSASSETKRRFREGRLLYHIPKEIGLNNEEECFIRVAISKHILLEDLKNDGDDPIKESKVADLMEVDLWSKKPELIEIDSLSEPIQIFEPEDFTEWCFDLTPHALGSYKVNIKVNVLEKDGDQYQKRTRNFRESIEVVAEDKVNTKEGRKEEKAIVLQDTGWVFLVPDTSPSPPPLPPPPSTPTTETGGSSFAPVFGRYLVPAFLLLWAVLFYFFLRGGSQDDTNLNSSLTINDLSYFPIAWESADIEETTGSDEETPSANPTPALTLKPTRLISRKPKEPEPRKLPASNPTMPPKEAFTPKSAKEVDTHFTLVLRTFSAHHPNLDCIDSETREVLPFAQIEVELNRRVYEIKTDREGALEVELPRWDGEQELTFTAFADSHYGLQKSFIKHPQDSLLEISLNLFQELDAVSFYSIWQDSFFRQKLSGLQIQRDPLDTVNNWCSYYDDGQLYLSRGWKEDEEVKFVASKPYGAELNPTDSIIYSFTLEAQDSAQEQELEFDLPYLSSPILHADAPKVNVREKPIKRKKVRVTLYGSQQRLRKPRFWARFEQDPDFRARSSSRRRAARLDSLGRFRVKSRRLLARKVRKDEDGNTALIIQTDSTKRVLKISLKSWRELISWQDKTKFQRLHGFTGYAAPKVVKSNKSDQLIQTFRQPSASTVPVILIQEGSLQKYGGPDRKILMRVGPRRFNRYYELHIPKAYYQTTLAPAQFQE